MYRRAIESRIKETLIKANFQELILVNLRKEVFPPEMAD